MIATKALANASMVFHNHHFLLMVRTRKIYSLNNFAVWSTALLTGVTMMDIRGMYIGQNDVH